MKSPNDFLYILFRFFLSTCLSFFVNSDLGLFLPPTSYSSPDKIKRDIPMVPGTSR
jgi:quinol-cytochrome oxidoreductase complex cytochrome b subunit